MPVQKNKTITLETLRQQLVGDASIPSKKAKLYASAISRFCRVVDRPPSEVLADPAVIRRLAGSASWQLAGLKKSSWSSIRSNLKAALSAGGISVLDRSRRNYVRSEAWEALLAQLTERGYRDMTRFAGWCSSHGIEPDAVDESVFGRFLHALKTESTQLHPKERWHLPRRIWNKEVVALTGGTAPEIANVETDRWRGLAWSDFPPSLVEEVDRYRHAMTTANKLDLNHRAIKPITVENYTRLLRQQLSRLVQDGVPPETFTSLAECVRHDRVNRALHLLLGDRPVDDTTRPTLSAVLIAYLSVAKYAQAPEADINYIRHMAKAHRHMAEDVHPRNEAKLAKLREPEALARFVMLPHTIAARIKPDGAPTVREAQLMRHAAVLELLLHEPMRIRNVAELDFDQHIQRVKSEEGLLWRIHVPGIQTKNGLRRDGVLNPTATALLERWRTEFRPVLEPSCSRVFIGRSGNGLLPSSLSKSLHRMIERELGLDVHAHLMRHFAAKNFLDAYPGEYETVRQLLGHKQIETTIRAYCGHDRESALRRYDEVIARMREFPDLDLL